MGKQRVPHSGAKACRRLRREILRRNRADQTDDPQRDEYKAHLHDVRPVLSRDAHVNNRSHDKGYKKFKRRLKHFEKRRQYGFFLVIFQVNKKRFHENILLSL